MTSWRIILDSIRQQPVFWIIHFLSMTVFMLLIQAQALVIGAFFDTLSGNVTYTIITLIIALFGVRLLRNLMQYLFVWATPPFLERVSAHIRHILLTKIFRRPGARALNQSTGDVISRFRSDALNIPEHILWLNESIALTLFAIVAIISMLQINQIITIIAILPLVVVVFIARASAQRIEIYRHATQQQAAQVAEFISEIFSAAQSVKITGREHSIAQHFASLNISRRNTALKDRVFSQMIFSISNNSTSLSTGLILLLSAPLLQNGAFTVAAFAVFVYYLEQLAWFIGRLGMVLARHHQLSVSIQRLGELSDIDNKNLLRVDLVPTTTSQKKLHTPLEELSVENMTYTFPNTANGIYNIDLTLHAGTLTVITGEVGSGKTTLLRVLLGLLPMNSGAIYWNNQLVSDPRTFFVPPKSAYTPQIPHLFSAQLRDNILLDWEATSSELMHTIDLAVLSTDIRQLDKGLETVVGPRGVKLSGGQRQRAAAARMFVRDPHLLIFDDISSALDVNTERSLWEHIRESGKTCLAVSHRSLVVKQADQVIRLQHGRISEE